MKLREIYNVALVRMGIRHILPIAYVNTKEIRECNEKVDPLNNPHIASYFGEELVGRATVVAKLEQIADKLAQQGLSLAIYELYRSREKQNQMRQVQRDDLLRQNPDISEQELLFQLNKRVSKEGGGHQTGGAVDLTICDSTGVPLDMGTAYSEFNTSTPTFSKTLTPEQKRNRTLLVSTMREAGFANYPLEWWHYSYGDTLWAAYANKPYAIFGCI